ncbi:MAG: hypothetical protein MJY77_05995, partial [Bacteroidaceae bacterium]|nr:hypothetical protein [Bacteroidaceae bacterium]
MTIFRTGLFSSQYPRTFHPRRRINVSNNNTNICFALIQGMIIFARTEATNNERQISGTRDKSNLSKFVSLYLRDQPCARRLRGYQLRRLEFELNFDYE